jgi:hypothetical protein
MSKKYKDGRDDTPNKPSAGVAKLHTEKDNASALASAGGTARQDKAAFDRKHGRNTAHPGAGVADEHLDQVAYEKARKHEPKPAKGAKYADGSTTTKCN